MPPTNTRRLFYSMKFEMHDMFEWLAVYPGSDTKRIHDKLSDGLTRYIQVMKWQKESREIEEFPDQNAFVVLIYASNEQVDQLTVKFYIGPRDRAIQIGEYLFVPGTLSMSHLRILCEMSHEVECIIANITDKLAETFYRGQRTMRENARQWVMEQIYRCR